jgi:metallo-beta-lactamase class B VIM
MNSAHAQATLPLDLDAVELRELVPGVWMHTSYALYPGGVRVPSNGLVIRDGASLLLVDTAWGELLTAALLARVERDLQLPLRRALLTHAHGDRLAGADLLRARGIEVLATPLTRRIALESGLPLPSDTLAGLRIAGSAISLGTVEIFFPGAGHAPDNLMVWIPSARTLYGACAVRAKAASALGNVAHADLARWRVAIERAIAQYPTAAVVVPGHGAPGDVGLLRHTLSLLPP